MLGFSIWNEPDDLPAENNDVVIIDKDEDIKKLKISKWDSLAMRVFNVQKWCYWDDLLNS